MNHIIPNIDHEFFSSLVVPSYEIFIFYEAISTLMCPCYTRALLNEKPYDTLIFSLHKQCSYELQQNLMQDFKATR